MPTRITPKYVAESLQRLESGALKFEPGTYRSGPPAKSASVDLRKPYYGSKKPFAADIYVHPDGEEAGDSFRGTEVHYWGGDPEEPSMMGLYHHGDPEIADKLTKHDLMNPEGLKGMGFKYYDNEYARGKQYPRKSEAARATSRLKFVPFDDGDHGEYNGADHPTAEISKHGNTEVIVDKNGGEVHFWKPGPDGLQDPDMYSHPDPDVVRSLRPQHLNPRSLLKLGFKQL